MPPDQPLIAPQRPKTRRAGPIGNPARQRYRRRCPARLQPVGAEPKHWYRARQPRWPPAQNQTLLFEAADPASASGPWQCAKRARSRNSGRRSINFGLNFGLGEVRDGGLAEARKALRFGNLILR